MAFTCTQMRAARPTAAPRTPAARTGTTSSSARTRATLVVARTSTTPSPKASLAAAAAALLLGSSTATALASPAADFIVPAASAGHAPVTQVAGLFPWPKVKGDDAFASGRKQESTVADTQRPIPIPTEQEAVAPEAFPNPSEAASPRPPVLAAAEGDEHLGANAGQFSDLTAAGRQELIDKKSPAESSRT